VGGGITLLVALSLGASVFATTRAVTARSLQRSSADLEAARSAFYRLADDRAEFASAQAALVTALPVFRAHMTDRRLAVDAATLEAMADDYRRQLKAAFSIVTDRDGAWTAQPGWPSRASTTEVRSPIADAVAGRSSRDIIVINRRLFLVVSEPARFDEELLGTLTAGYPLDDEFASRLAEITHCAVNLWGQDHLYASSLSGGDRQTLAALVERPDWPHAGISNTVEQIGARAFVIGDFPVSARARASGTGRLLLLQDWQPTQQFIDEVQRRLVAAGAAILIFALAAGFVFSRRMNRPLQDLAHAAEDIASGNWGRRVEIRGGAESTMMAQAFNEMTSSLQHWFEEARKRNDELRQAQKMEAIGRLAGGVAHDFNNLLTVIKGYGELLVESLGPDDRRHADAGEILKAADRASSLTRQLLAFSRRNTVAPRVLALEHVVSGIEQMLRRLIGEDVQLKTSIAPGIHRVMSDAGQIEQVLLNLAVNARDAMPNGGLLRLELANVTVEPGAGPSKLTPGPHVRLSVIDNGSGMTEETVAHIFEPFFTTKGEGVGTGLGLAMVYGVVNHAHGAIEVESEIGRGTAFHVYLPAADQPDEAPPPEAVSPLHATRGSETVLLVEDETHVATLIGAALRKSGYTILQATQGAQALEIVRTYQGQIDLLLTDVVMPGMNGRELADHVKLIRGETRVLYMSGYSDDAILRHGVQTNSAHFIQKPFSMDKLTLKLRQALADEAPTPGR
jgi:signal transduction histidine kinase/CheY-like chemotaxis protein